MQPVRQDVTIYEGDTFEIFMRLRSKVWDPETETYIKGDGVNITGWVGKGQVRASVDGTTAVNFAVVLANQTDLATRGGILFRLAPAITATLRTSGAMVLGTDGVFRGVYDLQLTTPGGDVYTYTKGTASLERQVTV